MTFEEAKVAMINFGFPVNDFNKEMGQLRTQTTSAGGLVMDKYRVTKASRKHDSHRADYHAVSSFKNFGGYAVDYSILACRECSYRKYTGVIFDREENMAYQHIFKEENAETEDLTLKFGGKRWN